MHPAVLTMCLTEIKQPIQRHVVFLLKRAVYFIFTGSGFRTEAINLPSREDELNAANWKK